MRALQVVMEKLQIVEHGVQLLAPIFSLMARLYAGKVFFLAGLAKLRSWESTLALFENEYQVPLLPPDLAAYMGTAAELTLPVLLVLGIGTRVTALAMFVFNIIAVISYPDISEGGVKDHLLWGWLLAMIFFYGAGRISADQWLRNRLLPAARSTP